jgi:hypothetical protein
MLTAATTPPLFASVSGVVREAGSGAPIPGARVRLQTTTSPVVVSAADGSFTLPVTFSGSRTVTASVPYDAFALTNHNSSGVDDVVDGQSAVVIQLEAIPSASGDPLALPTASFCGGCHDEHFAQWQTSQHAGAAVDPWVLDLFSGTGTPGGSAGYVFKNTHAPGASGFCATCHAALEDVSNPGHVLLDAASAPAALDGVGCLTCHAIDSVNTNASALHHLGNATYRFPDEPGASSWRFVWGPLPDVALVMRNSESAVFEHPRLCGSCHEYNNPVTNAPGQTTYSEWQASPYAVPGPAYRTCQDCHMPGALAPGPLSLFGTPIRPGDQRHAHDFVGATLKQLQLSITLAANAAEVAGQVRVQAQVTNQSGHAFPTGISIRNALLVVSAARAGVPLAQTSGPTIPFWADDDVPGQQPGDHAGQPGKGFARVLEGRIDGTGPVVRPVLFIDAENEFSNTLIPSGQTDGTTVTFAFPPGAQAGDVIDVSVRLLYRRAFRATAVTKGWTQTPQGGPIEIEVAQQQFQVTLSTPVELDGFRLE